MQFFGSTRFVLIAISRLERERSRCSQRPRAVHYCSTKIKNGGMKQQLAKPACRSANTPEKIYLHLKRLRKCFSNRIISTNTHEWAVEEIAANVHTTFLHLFAIFCWWTDSFTRCKPYPMVLHTWVLWAYRRKQRVGALWVRKLREVWDIHDQRSDYNEQTSLALLCLILRNPLLISLICPKSQMRRLSPSEFDIE